MDENNLPRQPVDEELREDLLREWGIPDDMVPYAHWAYYTWTLPQIPPQIDLPAGWNPSNDPTLDRVLAALATRAGLDIWASAPMDLSWFEPQAEQISSLWCRGDTRAFQSLKTIEKMTGLQSLMLPRASDVLELSDLPRLRHVFVVHKNHLSVVHAPRLTSLSLTLSTVPAHFQLTPQVKEVAFHTRSVNLAAIGDLSNLREIFIEGAAHVDLSPLADAGHLEKIKFLRVREVTGAAALKNCSRLREVDLIYTTAIDDTDSLLGLELERFHGEGRAFDESFADTAGRKNGWWLVLMPNRPRTTSTAADFSVHITDDDRAEVSLRDFGWLADRAGMDDDDLTSEDIEVLCQHELRRTHPDWLENDILTFDSEGDQFNVIAPNSAIAEELIAAMNRLFANKSRLRRALREARA
ncbi:hypothetical protein [Microbacterium invictum]|uniref:Uncharacterized protein n=1 Tax=Microbacterium invictum TaxID=515415 RepID=A0ABZ0VGE3_9MICO|nr:hypothetical protein [Microbacterium invictum]WQB70867.1 hypothetical protein T9R20_02600 [Microbacterium invictum]